MFYLVKLKTATSFKHCINKQKENENPSIETITKFIYYNLVPVAYSKFL